ncbi:MAG: RNA 3'-terminal phosphate cyclase [Candidatus Bathyarchaeota archaeon]|uniref:RNA 3'-terminal phosphate cyclase n=1 Tax=Candidatus Bathycorpusculum sp. TaxID=2994959 RepID=UPI00281CC0D2|nr:RNA 3'-terminal phosphate cyclase [Candidatus Termiticorpusculum sp.]MCL2257339.1 RNA 3'-terminal phosphate cyclase [Candidatus Termiticorpusculum sp.]MCL2292548.1 RNA 3'-terminal phosphate cyclase [Candidatus Termiticorpusculum sp.]
MFEIDGSQKSGSGTILRLAVAISAIMQQPLHIENIRSKRPQPGLKRQHLESVLTAAKLCNATVEGATLGSDELWFTPNTIEGGNVEAVIETAGSIPMLFLASLPLCVYAKTPVTLHVAKGGTDTLHAPTINYLRFVLLPVLCKLGVNAEISVQKYGYYPKGLGEATLTVKPAALKAFQFNRFGSLKSVSGVSVCTFLSERQVAQRQADSAMNFLAKNSYPTQIQVLNDHSNPYQRGSSITLWAKTDTDVLVGADALGGIGKTSESVGVKAAEKLILELAAKPSVDVFLADMLIPYIALAPGRSVFYTRCLSEHIEANIWLMETMLNSTFNIEKINNLLYQIEKTS